MSEVRARVSWTAGQVLLPAHFRSLEDSLASEGAVWGGLGGLPCHGLLSLDWNGLDPTGKSIEVRAVRWLTAMGRVVDLPGNACGPARIDFPDGPSASPVEIYLYRSDDDGEVGTSDSAPTAPRFTRHRLSLSLDGTPESGVERIRLGSYELRGARWSIVPASAPPLLSLVRTDYLLARLRELDGALPDFARDLVLRSASSDLAVAQCVAVGHAVIEAQKLMGTLGDLLHGSIEPGRGAVDLHPYPIFVALRSFVIAVQRLAVVAPPPNIQRYDHDAPGRCIGGLLDLIDARLRDRPAGPPR